MGHSHSKQRIILGGFLVTVGILALLDKLGILSIGNLLQFWPILFVLIGIMKIANSRAPSSLVMGGSFIVLGIVMMLSHLGVFHFTWRDLWPILLIGVGHTIMFKNCSHDRNPQNDLSSGNGAASDNSVLDITAVMGGNKTVNNSHDFKGGELTAIMGGIELDLRSASIQSEAVLNLWATWGGIALKIPADWVVINRCTAIMGGIEDKSFPSPTSTKRLIITGTAIMGGVEIKN